MIDLLGTDCGSSASSSKNEKAEALSRLSEQQKRLISINELARRASVPRGNLHYHPNAGKRASDKRRVPAELVVALAKVLPISEADLMRAAQVPRATKCATTATICPTGGGDRALPRCRPGPRGASPSADRAAEDRVRGDVPRGVRLQTKLIDGTDRS